jgi:ATP-dependent Clp protease ATP-binding subunit ClpB
MIYYDKIAIDQSSQIATRLPKTKPVTPYQQLTLPCRCYRPPHPLPRSQGFDPVYGARPVKRALQRELQTLLAQALLRGEFVEGDVILVQAAADGSGLQLSKGNTNAALTATAAAAAAGEQVANGEPLQEEEEQQQQVAAVPAGASAGKPPGRRVVVRGASKKVPSSAASAGEKQQANGVANGNGIA